ncbi:MDR family MFS transporter [Aliikangiella coralliicola]|uniref:MFS transporter n=1 Tax=Aliikangiella coralliicola TaxID=2592383 RepID=A0A545UFB1_9GAMM|nr:MFS transporter [Aliikangiella coralliicola]TQV88160.1 MFS transporter [Aliikangiella coralliicola]
MENTLSFQRLKRFPSLIWLYLIGTFITRGSYFMVWPFLAVLLYRQFSLSATDIGLILSISAIASAGIGFYVGNLSDRFGRRLIMLSGGLLGLIAFVTLSVANSVWIYVVAIALSSASRALWEPTSKALIGDLLPDAKDRELALQAAYFLTNAGGAIGPLIGISLGLTTQQETFLITAVAYFLLTAGMYWGFNQNAHLLKRQKISEHNMKQTIKLLSQDHLFLVLIVANLIVMFVYAHADSSLIQYLTQANTPGLVTLITVLVVTNSVTIVLFQFPLLHLMQHMAINNRIYVGLSLLFASQVMFALSPTDGYWSWIAAMFVLSLGEAILFPTMNIQIDQLAPSHLRGSYFGATSFYSLGYAAAPLAGGLLIDYYSGQVLYQLTSVLIILTVFLYLVSKNLKRPSFSGEPVKQVAE